MTIERITAVPRHPDREAESHKGDYGRVLILAGSRGMAGAGALCGLGALRGGAGLVTVACPASLANTVTAIEPGLMTMPLPEEDGHVADPAPDGWSDELSNRDWDAVALGPGLGQSDAAKTAARLIFTGWELPLVIDADGLNALCHPSTGQGLAWEPHNDFPRVLTPHPGEFARLLGPDVSVKEVQADREGLAVKFAAEHNVVLLLKGSRTLVTDGDRLFENRTGNPGMASGGCGDVLTGLIAALIGQGMEPFEAACCGAHLHGRAGDLAAAALSQPGLIASDLPRFIAHAFADPAYERADGDG
ncbi:NAD(P)H-hydrate dehydratase [Alienimonas californiensis]|uniref:ADP-dependent (S)-NAD(P)H-hydrate dehydratase n=1 Tax=Alienimonas californiensis TaxID=2527989 RepID=A0A517P9D3_9PLAN|nr:NAD(P)H-hydrate dehydratase [Alienimonas californiensis]QDT15981.1 ATP-dependent (S)-NAD(P)H-hydrate dehydratase [Alienimonas californiensis]